MKLSYLRVPFVILEFNLLSYEFYVYSVVFSHFIFIILKQNNFHSSFWKIVNDFFCFLSNKIYWFLSFSIYSSSKISSCGAFLGLNMSAYLAPWGIFELGSISSFELNQVFMCIQHSCFKYFLIDVKKPGKKNFGPYQVVL